MKIKTFCELCLGLLLFLNVSGCKNEQPSNIKDGAVVISGDLTYDKLMDALAPFVKKDNESFIKNEDGFTIHKIAVSRDLRKISISNVIDLVFTQSDKVSAILKIPDEWSRYYRASYADGVLKIGTQQNTSLKMNNHSVHVKLYVSAPNLSDLDLSGVCTAKLEDINTHSNFNIKCSGVGNVAIRSLTNAGVLKIQSDGASNVAIKTLNVSSLDADVSGASNLSVERMDTKNVNGNVNGASNISLNGCCDRILMMVSGASKSDLSGKANFAEMKASGISKIDLNGFLCSNIKKETSGMSQIKD